MISTNTRQTAEKAKTEKKIGGTTYVVTSHFRKEGSTAVDRIRSLLSTDISHRGSCRKS